MVVVSYSDTKKIEALLYSKLDFKAWLSIRNQGRKDNSYFLNSKGNLELDEDFVYETEEDYILKEINPFGQKQILENKK